MVKNESKNKKRKKDKIEKDALAKTVRNFAITVEY